MKMTLLAMVPTIREKPNTLLTSFKPFDIAFHKAPTMSTSMTTLHGKANVDPKPLFIIHGGIGKEDMSNLGKMKDNTKRS